MRPALLILLSFNLFSCASYFKRQSCESTNWFDYGKKVALEGRRLTGDQFIVECQKADADISASILDQGFKAGMQIYCTPEGIYKVGREGNFFNTEMCEGNGLNTLKSRHATGVNEYCQKANGYSAGTVGNPYNKICPVSLERDFLPEFNRGRLKYLQTIISQNQNQIRDYEQKSSSAQSQLAYKRVTLSQMQSRAAQSTDKDWAQRASQLNSEVNTLSYEVRSYHSKIEDLKAKNRAYEIEAVRLGQ